MIPDFKTYIKESMWGDIHRRNSGVMARKEDNIDFMDIDGFFDYLINHYDTTYPQNSLDNINLQLMGYPDSPGIEDLIYMNILHFSDVPELHITNNKLRFTSSQLYRKMCKKFHLEKVNNRIYTDIQVTPKEGEFNNSFIIEVIEFIIDNMDEAFTPKIQRKESIKESMWGDIHRRNSGEVTRKEDDVNIMDMVGLYEYILSHYEPVTPNGEMTYGTSNMCIVAKDGSEILLTYNFGEVHFFFNVLRKKSLYDALLKQFNVVQEHTLHFRIMPKGDCTNQFFIDVLDCIVANTKTLLKKKDNVNESMWGDIHRRNSGESIRKEDDVNFLDKDEFFEYVMSHYEVTRDDEKMSYNRSMCVPILKIKGERRYAIILNYLAGYVEAHFHLERWPEVYSALEKKFNVDSISRYGNSYLIGMKNKDVNQINQFFLDVIDTIIENAEFSILRKK